jgi:hypothetical protein
MFFNYCTTKIRKLLIRTTIRGDFYLNFPYFNNFLLFFDKNIFLFKKLFLHLHIEKQ